MEEPQMNLKFIIGPQELLALDSSDLQLVKL
jgi:hypothetical protein